MDENGISISIVVPVYEDDEFFAECFYSIKNQSISTFECLVIDDGSSDSVSYRIRDLVETDKRFIYIKQKHQGVSVARNTGMEKAKGEHIIFLDSDDFFSSTLLEELSCLMMKHDTDIVICNSKKYNTTTRRYGDLFLDGDKIPKEVFSYNDISEMLFNSLNGAVWNKMFKKNFLTKNNIKYTPGIHISEDTLFVDEALLAARRMFFVNKVLVFHRIGNKKSASYNALLYSGDIEIVADTIHLLITKYNLEKELEYSYKVWLINKLRWIQKLLDDEHKRDTMFIDKKTVEMIDRLFLRYNLSDIKKPSKA